VIVTGLLGSLTTFTTLGYETIELARNGRMTAALANVAANALIGLPCVILGRNLASG
jgi:CrcB protein